MEFLIIEESIAYIPEQGQCPAQCVKDDKVIFNSDLRYRIQQFPNYLKLMLPDHPRSPAKHIYGNITVQNNRGDLIGKYATELADKARYGEIGGEYDLDEITFIRNYGHCFIQVRKTLYLMVGSTDDLTFTVKALDEVTGGEETRVVTSDGCRDDYLLLLPITANHTSPLVTTFFDDQSSHHTTTIQKITLVKECPGSDIGSRWIIRELKPLKIIGIKGEFIPVDSIDII